MLAKLAAEIPRGDGLRYEPKWDGFRAIVFRDADRVHIGSRNRLPLERYFPEIVDVARERLPERCVADGEIVIPGEAGLDFEALQLRLHPAASRVRKLASETPAAFVAFDLLAAGDDDLRPRPFDDRRAALVRAVAATERCFATPQTDDPGEAERWFDQFEGAGLDGIVAKRGDQRYVHGERVMAKIKHERTVDCVVGGYRVGKDGKRIGSLILGLFDGEGTMHHVGHTSTFTAKQRAEMVEVLRPLEEPGAFEGGRAPGGPSRWSQGRDLSWVPLRPKLVCEVAFDHLQGDRFRHGARFVRWRPDKDPAGCTFDQIAPPRPFSLGDIVALAARSGPAPAR